MAITQSLTVLSHEADARNLPSGEKGTELTDDLKRLQHHYSGGIPEFDCLVP